MCTQARLAPVNKDTRTEAKHLDVREFEVGLTGQLIEVNSYRINIYALGLKSHEWNKHSKYGIKLNFEHVSKLRIG